MLTCFLWKWSGMLRARQNAFSSILCSRVFGSERRMAPLLWRFLLTKLLPALLEALGGWGCEGHSLWLEITATLPTKVCLISIHRDRATDELKPKSGNKLSNHSNPEAVPSSAEGAKSLAIQWLGLHTFTAKGLGSVPGQGTKIPQAAQPKKKERKSC